MPNCRGGVTPTKACLRQGERRLMLPIAQARTMSRAGAVPRWLAGLAATAAVILAGAVLSGCTGSSTPSDLISNLTSPAQPPAQASAAIGAGRVKVGLILPLSGSRN